VKDCQLETGETKRNHVMPLNSVPQESTAMCVEENDVIDSDAWPLNDARIRELPDLDLYVVSRVLV
jgi:hypothetical protein